MTGPFARIYQVPAVCRECEAQWETKSFKPPGETPIETLCPQCNALLDARIREFEKARPDVARTIRRVRQKMVTPTETNG